MKAIVVLLAMQAAEAKPVEAPKVWSFAWEAGKKSEPAEREALSKVRGAAREGRVEVPWKNEPSRAADGTPPNVYRSNREREALASGKLPELVQDEAGWDRLLKVLGDDLKLAADVLDPLRKAKPDFSKDRLLLLSLESHSRGYSTEAVDLKGVMEEADAVRVIVAFRGGGGGAARSEDDRRDKLELRILRLGAGPKKVILREERTQALFP